MKSRLYIIPLIIIYFILCGRSCDDDDARTIWQEGQAEIEKDSIRIEFEVDYLTEEGRYAAGIKAAQELEDLADYMEIFTDVSYDSLFRQKAREMISGIFISEEVRLSFGPIKKEKMKPVTVKEFLENGFGKTVLKAEVGFDSLRVMQPLQKSGEETYSGMLSAYQTLILHSNHSDTISNSIPVTINFISYKQIKVFGPDTLKVWKVSFGDFDGNQRN